MSPAALLLLAALAPAAPPAAAVGLQRGDELTYTGTVTEAVDRPGNRFRRAHELEVRILVLERRENSVDVAVLTLLRRGNDAAVAGAVPVVTGNKPEATPPAARLDLVRVHADGSTHLLLPPGPLPLALNADTPARVLPAIPLDSFAPFEFGMFPPRQPAAGPPWTIASTDPTRPAETWQTDGDGYVSAARCAKFVMAQRSADWEKPQGGQTAWQRADAVWVSTQDGTARRVQRVVRQRDGIAASPAVWIEVKYELKDQSRITGRTFTRYRHEVEFAYAAAAELAPLLRDAARLGPKPFQARLAKVDSHLLENDPGTPYREPVLAVRRQLEAACRGETAPLAAPVGPPGANRVPIVGQPAPEIRTAGFDLGANRGKPVVLVFFSPGTETADLSLTIADALRKRYGDRAAVAPLVVFGEAATGTKDRDRLKLSVPVHDGAAAGSAYGVETFPRFLVIDAAGKLRWSFVGVGAETGYLVREEVDRLVAPASGTITPPGTAYPPIPPRLPPAERP